MGPTILFDKSALQALSHSAWRVVANLFIRVISPVICLEILSDIEKENTLNVRQHASRIAEKCLPPDAYHTADFRPLLLDNLLGGPNRMKRVAVVSGGIEFKAPDGKFGSYIGPQPEQLAIARWAQERFLQSDEAVARRLRRDIHSIDLERLRDDITRVQPLAFKLRSMPQLIEFVDHFSVHEDAQETLITLALKLAEAVEPAREWTFHRWRNSNAQLLKDFAPFAAHCVRVEVAFHLALMNHLIGPRSTNQIDRLYFFYTPFSQIFTSGDAIHRKFSFLLESDQEFVWRDDLVKALNVLSRTCADSEGRLLPLIPEDNLISLLWKRHLSNSN